MEWSEITKDWAKVQNKFTSKWSKLTESDLTTIGGKRDELVKKLESHYSLEKSAAQKDVDSFVKTLHA
jgi:uncharacterized protein YjbJ (UPF0337 family)